MEFCQLATKTLDIDSVRSHTQELLRAYGRVSECVEVIRTQYYILLHAEEQEEKIQAALSVGMLAGMIKGNCDIESLSGWLDSLSGDFAKAFGKQ